MSDNNKDIYFSLQKENIMNMMRTLNNGRCVREAFVDFMTMNIVLSRHSKFTL